MAATRHRLTRGALVLATCAAVAGGCGGAAAKKELRVRRVYLVAPVGASPAAMYFVVENDGVWADTLISVSTPAAAATELHETVPMPPAPAIDTGARAGRGRTAAAPMTGMMTMVPTSLVTVPAHSVTQFAPGGRHAMLMSPHEGLKRGDTVTVTFVFMRRGEMRTRGVVISYADVDTATAAPPAEP